MHSATPDRPWSARRVSELPIAYRLRAGEYGTDILAVSSANRIREAIEVGAEAFEYFHDRAAVLGADVVPHLWIAGGDAG